MLQFDLIGSIDLRRSDNEEIDQLLRQPKRLALLAYLATPFPGTWHRRDTLLAVFWPTLDSAHARTALRNGLYVLRQSLGDGVVLGRGDEEVSIDPSSLATDLASLWSAIRDGRADDALALYRGDLLPGLYPGDSEGFNSWLESQRARLRGEVVRLGARHAERLESEHREADALRVATRIVEISPDDETAVRRALRLHDAMGDRAGGLVIYERFTAWLRNELGAEPASETTAIAERLRRSKERTQLASASPQEGFDVAEASAPAGSPRRQDRRALSMVVAAVVVALAVMLTGFVVTVLAPTRTAAIGKSHPVTSADGLQIEPALSPNGRLVAYAKGAPGHVRIWVQRLDGGMAWPLTQDTTATELVPRWSPQNDQILFLSRNHAWVSVAVGGTARMVAAGIDDDRSVRSASWSPAGDSVLFVRNDSLQVKALDGPGARFVGTGRQIHSCVWSPDGHWIACVTGNWISFVPGPLFGNRAPTGILIFPATGGAAVPITDQEHQYESPSWSQDGRELWVLSNRDGLWGEVYAIRVGRDGRSAAAPVRMGLTAQWISHGARGLTYSDYSRSANVWSLPISSAQLRAPLRADDATRVTSGHRIIEIASVSPDHRWLVYDSNERGNSDIYRVSLDNPTGPAERLTEDAREEFAGVQSPDGRYLAYHVWAGGERRLRVKRLADGTIEEPVPAPGDQSTPRWSPDGNAIAAWAHETESGAIFVVRRKQQGGWGQPAWRLAGAQLPVWSPDGAALAFVTLNGNVELIPADSGGRRVLYAPRPGTSDPIATNVVWEAGRSYLWFIGQTPAGEGGIWMLPLEGGRPSQVVSLVTTRGATYGPVFDSDGTHLYFVLDERTGNVHYAELVKR
jgi:Tol biopolymer transport system component/DNA-binding SARP family transcriptional activator